MISQYRELLISPGYTGGILAPGSPGAFAGLMKCRMPTHLRGPRMRVGAHQEELHGAVLLHGQRQREVAEGVKGDRHLGAFWAHQGGFEEAVENVNYDGVVTQTMISPGFLSHNL